MLRMILAVVAGMTCVSPLFAQDMSLGGQRGLPFITNYTPREYGAGAQNWGIVQDDRGVMYFGNTHGVLEFDGVSWRLIEVPSTTGARWLAKDERGTIYVSVYGGFGYLRPNEVGALEYASMLEHVPNSLRDFTSVFQVAVTSRFIYFRTDKYLFRWDGVAMLAFVAPEGFHVGAVVADTYYVRQWGVGLMRMEDDGPRLVSDGGRFAQDRIYTILPYGDEGLLIGTRNAGFFVYDGESFTPFATEADDYLREFGLYLPGAVLNDGSFVFGTTGGGAVRLDREGRLIQLFTKDAGLQDGAVWYTFVDRSGDLWLGLDQGITRIETGSPYTVFGEHAGIETSVLSVGSLGSTIYAGTSSYLLQLRADRNKFEILPGSNDQIQDLVAHYDQMLVGTGRDGLFSAGRDRLIHIAGGDRPSGFGVGTILPSKYNQNLIYIGGRVGIVALERQDSGGFREVGRTELPDGSNLVEFDEGDLWVGLSAEISRVSIPFENGRPAMEKASVTTYGSNRGLPGSSVFLFNIRGHLLAVSNGRIYRFDGTSDRFHPDVEYWSQEGPAGSLKEDRFGRVWSVFGGVIALGTLQNDGSLNWDTNRFRRLSDAQPGAIHVDENGVVWIATLDGLVRYDPALEDSTASSFRALIRSVTIGDDSLIYAGSATSLPAPLLQARDNSIHFGFAAASYPSTSSNRFRTFLEGFDDGWSAWGAETSRTYTNLPPGDYRFRVNAMNVFGAESEEDTYSFVILPPWYQTWWAYSLYFALFSAVAVLIGWTQQRHLLRKERERSRLREAELRAETAAAEAKALAAEAAQHRNIAVLSEVGRSITATLSVEAIIDTVYENVNALMDAAVFGIGLYNPETDAIDFPATRERGMRREPHSHPVDDHAHLASWCFRNQREILIADFESESQNYVDAMPVRSEGAPASILYLPLVNNDKRIGVITAQSFAKHAYSDYHLNILQNLATYAAIALDNAEAYTRLSETVDALNKTLHELKRTQDQLITQEKMASLGQLTAGIAHEIKNPLNFVNNFSVLSIELCDELTELVEGNRDVLPEHLAEEFTEVVDGLRTNASQISKHGTRADAIVKSMMQHASKVSTERSTIAVNRFVDEYVDLAYHGIKVQTPDLDVTVVRDFDEAAGDVIVLPQEMGRVLVNLLNNAFYAVHERGKSTGDDFSPTVTVTTMRTDTEVIIAVMDNGPGIPDAIKDRIFEPLFTTKPAGSGTGLGLSLAFEIVTRGHGGKVEVDSKEGEGATFVVTLPV